MIFFIEIWGSREYDITLNCERSKFSQINLSEEMFAHEQQRTENNRGLNKTAHFPLVWMSTLL